MRLSQRPVRARRSINFPDDAVELVGVFYDNFTAYKATRQTLEWRTGGWRDRVGSPTDYVLEMRPCGPSAFTHTSVDSTAYIFMGSDPMGADYPTYTAVE